MFAFPLLSTLFTCEWLDKSTGVMRHTPFIQLEQRILPFCHINSCGLFARRVFWVSTWQGRKREKETQTGRMWWQRQQQKQQRRRWHHIEPQRDSERRCFTSGKTSLETFCRHPPCTFCFFPPSCRRCFLLRHWRYLRDGGTDSAAPPGPIMAYYMTFSALNEKLRPRINTSDRLYSTLNRLEDRQIGSLRTYPISYRPTILSEINRPENKQEPEDHVQQQVKDLTSDLQEEGSESPPVDAPVQLTELSLNDGEEQRVDEEKDVPGELTSSAADGPSQSSTGVDASPLRQSYDDGTLPDLIRSGRPLGRRRTLGHVSETVGWYSLCVGQKHEAWWLSSKSWIYKMCLCHQLAEPTVKPVTQGATCSNSRYGFTVCWRCSLVRPEHPNLKIQSLKVSWAVLNCDSFTTW